MIGIKRGALALLVIILGCVFWLWLTLLSPWFYERPAHLAPIEPRTHQVFVYGTLRLAPVRWLVMRAGGDPQSDALEGFRREGLDLTPAPQGTVPGLLLTVTPQQLARLDRYERLGVRYRREAQRLQSGEQAWVYRRLADPSSLTTAAPGEQALLGYQPTTLKAATPPNDHRLAANDAFVPSAEPQPIKETI